MKALLLQPGTQYSYTMAYHLHKAGLLYKFATCIAWGDNGDSFFWKMMRLARLEKPLSRRLVKGVSSEWLYRMPGPELVALIRMRLGHHWETLFYRRNRIFQQRLPQYLIDECDVVISFDTFSWIIAERCKQSGKPFILDASIAHPLSKERVYSQIRKRFANWAYQVTPKDDHLIQLEVKEMQQATLIVAASQFTKKTYVENGVEENKIVLNPYGINHLFFTSKWINHKAVQQRHPAIHFYFFGTINARKGIPWLCSVWEKIYAQYPLCKLTIAGSGEVPPGFRMPDGITRIGFVHPQDRLRYFHEADVFVFPSYFEGFAQVIPEAMACGLPVITTAQTIGPELITDNENGFIVEAGVDDALITAMEYFIKNPDEVKRMGQKAVTSVAMLTWEAYGKRWKQLLEQLLIQ